MGEPRECNVYILFMPLVTATIPSPHDQDPMFTLGACFMGSAYRETESFVTGANSGRQHISKEWPVTVPGGQSGFA